MTPRNKADLCLGSLGRTLQFPEHMLFRGEKPQKRGKIKRRIKENAFIDGKSYEGEASFDDPSRHHRIDE